METNINIDNFLMSTTYKHVADVIALTLPLKQINVKYFSRLAVFPNGQFSCLINSDTWPIHYIKNNFFYIDPITFSRQKEKDGFYILEPKIFQPSKVHDVFFKLIKEVNDVQTSCFFVNTDKNGVRYSYCYGISSADFYQYDWLEAFNHYFDEKAAILIQKSDRMTLPKCIPQQFKNIPQYVLTPDNQIIEGRLKTLQPEFPIVKYRSIAFGKRHGLTVRETECLSLLLQGQLTKQMAAQLGISTRTAEEYMNAIKQKLQCRTKTDIVLKVTGYH